ncbi:MAG: (Fe-S)-binding protein, partial [Thiohalocapsa sp.]
SREGRLAVLDGLLRQLVLPRRPHGAASPILRRASPEAAAVGFFVGCVSRGLQAPTADSARVVLERLGMPLSVPAQQTCCGAMHRHNGHPGAADRLLTRNREAFANKTAVGFASACVAELQQGMDAVELCRLLVDARWPAQLRLRPLPALVAVHEPCSHRNLLRDTRAVYALLGRIPELRVLALDGNDSCCGAAGTYLLDHTETALSLAADKVRDVAALGPRFLVTTNTGCAAHLAARLRAAGLEVEVVHPVDLIARQLPA